MLVLIRGAGDLATGIALRLFRSHLCVAMTDLPQPTAIRRTVCFSQPKAMESSCTMGAPSVAMLISTSTVWMSFSLLRPICRVWMPRRFCASILAK